MAPTSFELLEQARSVATVAHAGQRRHGGEPYIVHPARVADAVREFGTHAEIVAWLHDVLEDTKVTTLALLQLSFPTDIVMDVLKLTRKDGQSYKSYIDRLIADGSDVALRVKLADLFDNLRDDPRPGMEERYQRSIQAVLEEQERRNAAIDDPAAEAELEAIYAG